MTIRQMKEVKIEENTIWVQRDEHFFLAVSLLLTGRTEESQQGKPLGNRLQRCHVLLLDSSAFMDHLLFLPASPCGDTVR